MRWKHGFRVSNHVILEVLSYMCMFHSSSKNRATIMALSSNPDMAERMAALVPLPSSEVFTIYFCMGNR